MRANTCYCPPVAEGKRVDVLLRCGVIARDWPADGKGACRWTLSGQAHDIVEFEVLK